ncbi:DUF2332 domain-containing protein [Ornithinimicrobium murale]|uniref:DUF2332 domain-containing protein n=1 Tax=Ornithinimicrobium murale TaxID=1050153 RepID=UPI000E0CE9FE|nr:DUF2332 domain-containing protein [Ornithinimicrobium murale]
MSSSARTGWGRQVELIGQQAVACRALGSPFYGHLLEQVAQDLSRGGPTATVLAGHEDDPGPSALALRLMAAVHRLVLTGGAPALAAHYASVGGDGSAAAAWPALRGVLEELGQDIRERLGSPPQTNEVGRSAALFGGLLQVLSRAQHPDLPVRLLEIGASAGLNLLADHFTYRVAEGGGWPAAGGAPVDGPADGVADGMADGVADGVADGMADGVADADPDARPTTVVLDPAWESRPLGIPTAVEVVERLGCDLAPIDPRSQDGALDLLSCVWPDQTHRLSRLRGALSLAQEHEVRLERAGGGDFLDRLELRESHHTVVWHSVMWQYVPAEEQERMLDRLAALGAEADPERTLTHLAFEPRRLEPGGPHRFLVAATTWPGGTERLLGEAPPHGVPVRWGDPRTLA